MQHAVSSTGALPAPGEQPGLLTRPVMLACGLLLLVGLAYANAVSHPFVYDDTRLVLENPRIRSLANLPEIAGFTEQGFRPKSRWTREASYALEYSVFGPWPPAYHATNIALHAAVGLLIFLLITRLSGQRMLAWWAAALWVAHPIHGEVVAHVSGRRDLLAALFSLTTLLLLLAYTRRGGAWRVVTAVVCYVLGVFSKEGAFLTPAAFVMIDAFCELRSEAGRRRTPALALRDLVTRRWRLYAVLLVVAAALGAWFLSGRAVIAPSHGFYDTQGGGLGIVNRLGLFGLGLRLIAAPIGQSVDYSFDALRVTADSWRTLLPLDLAVLLAAVVAAGIGIFRRSWAAFAGLWFAIYFLPHTGIIAWHEVFAERFLYLPTVGVFVGIAAAGLALARRIGPRPAAACGVVILAALTTATLARNGVWSSSLALWSSAVERYPTCARAHKALGDAYLAETRADLAQQHYERAADISPNYLEARVAVAIALTAQRQYATALAELDRILAKWPGTPYALNLKGYIHQTLGDLPAAMAAYEAAVEHDPHFADGYNNLAQLYVERGDLVRAVELYKRALEENPALTAAWRNLATVYREGFEDDEQADYYDAQADLLTHVR